MLGYVLPDPHKLNINTLQILSSVNCTTAELYIRPMAASPQEVIW